MGILRDGPADDAPVIGVYIGKTTDMITTIPCPDEARAMSLAREMRDTMARHCGNAELSVDLAMVDGWLTEKGEAPFDPFAQTVESPPPSVRDLQLALTNDIITAAKDHFPEGPRTWLQRRRSPG